MADAHLSSGGWDWTYDTATPATLKSVTRTGTDPAELAVNIPTNLDGATPLTTIGDYSCVSAAFTKILSMPSTVTRIGEGSIIWLANLTSVVIGSGVTTIAGTAFSECLALTSIAFAGLVAPGTVGGGWITDVPAACRGHAYAPSTFPAPGEDFHGLTMGTIIDTNASCTTLVIPAGAVMASSVAGSKLIVGAGGILVQASGNLDRTNISIIESLGNVDLSAGASTEGTEQWIMHAVMPTFKLPASGHVYDLICEGGLSLQSDVIVDKIFAHVGPVVKNGHTLTLTHPELEYTGMRRPLAKKLRKKQINNLAARLLLEDLETAY